MNSIKLFGFIAVAALMGVLFSSTSAAMAEGTALCVVDEVPCAVGNTVIHIHETSVGKAKLLSSLPTIECNVLFLGEILTALNSSGPVTMHGHFTYSGCNNFCSVSEPLGQDSLISILRLGEHLGDTTGEGEVHVSCPFINCTYNGEGLEGHALDPLTSSQANGSVVITKQETHIVSGSCPESAFLDLTTTPLAGVYISR